MARAGDAQSDFKAATVAADVPGMTAWGLLLLPQQVPQSLLDEALNRDAAPHRAQLQPLVQVGGHSDREQH